MHGSFLEGKGTVKCGSPWTTSTDTVAAGGVVEVAGILLLEDTKEPENIFRIYFGNFDDEKLSNIIWQEKLCASENVEVAGILLLEDTKEPENNVRLILVILLIKNLAL